MQEYKSKPTARARRRGPIAALDSASPVWSLISAPERSISSGMASKPPDGLLTARSVSIGSVAIRSLAIASLAIASLAVVSLAVPADLAAQPAAARAAIVALPRDSTGGTDNLYYLDLHNGAVIHGDQLRRDPLEIRVRRLRQNLFAEIGRPTDQPAGAGEILIAPIYVTARSVRAVLFVETSTGFVAFYDQLGKADTFGRITTAIGRPFAPLASPDGNFALLTRHDTNARTIGAYLYHAGSGRGFYLPGVNRLQTDATATAASGFPRLSGRVSAAELQRFDRTAGYLIADAADGSLRFLDTNDAPARVTVRDTSASLFPTFSAEAASRVPQRFVAVPIRDSREVTTHVLFVDVATGDLAVFDGMDSDSRQPRARKLAANLYGVLGTASDSGSRIVAAVPGVAGNGATVGIWLIDSLTRAVAYVADPASPAATVRRVRIGS